MKYVIDGIEVDKDTYDLYHATSLEMRDKVLILIEKSNSDNNDVSITTSSNLPRTNVPRFARTTGKAASVDDQIPSQEKTVKSMNLIKFLWKFKYVILIALVTVIAIIIYMFVTMNNEAKQCYNLYTQLGSTNKPTNSKTGYSKKLYYITVLVESGAMTIEDAESLTEEEALAELHEMGITDQELASGLVTPAGTQNAENTNVTLSGDVLEITWPITGAHYWSTDHTVPCGPISKYYGLGREFGNTTYRDYSWSRTSVQRQLCDKIKGSLNVSNTYATYDNMPLTAMSPYFGNLVGWVVQVEWENGDRCNMLVIDSKSNTDSWPNPHSWPNASCFSDSAGSMPLGHYYVEAEKLAITEMICDRSNVAAFNAQFGTNLDSATKVVKISKTTRCVLNE